MACDTLEHGAKNSPVAGFEPRAYGSTVRRSSICAISLKTMLRLGPGFFYFLVSNVCSIETHLKANIENIWFPNA